MSELYNHDHKQPDRSRKRQFVELTASTYEYCYDNPVRFVDPTGEQAPPNVPGHTVKTVIIGTDGKAIPEWNKSSIRE